jgi:CheY-like chemotaxis protein
MPDTDGYGLIEELRRLPGAHGIPVLALTAFASADEQQRIREAGFDAYLAKPIGAAEIGAAVAELATGRERGAG